MLSLCVQHSKFNLTFKIYLCFLSSASRAFLRSSSTCCMHDLSLELVWVVGRFREGEVQHTAEKLKVVKLKRPAAKIGRLISEPSLIAESGDRKLFMVDFWESRAIRYRLYSGCVETCPDA